MYKIVITPMTSQVGQPKEEQFGKWLDAYGYYLTFAESHNLNNVEYTGAEMNLSAGGIGYDYRIELIVEE